MLIKGSTLNAKQREQVRAAFVHRHTVENGQRFAEGCTLCHYRGDSLTGKTLAEWHAYHVPETTDDQWIADHAFHFVRDGSRLHARRNVAERAQTLAGG